MSISEISPHVAARLTLQQMAQIARLEEWNLSVVTDRAAKRLGWRQDYADNVSSEYKKFLVLIAIQPQQRYGMAGPVDELWHEHLLHTRDYFDMCFHVFGEFIHHEPRGNEQEDLTQDYYELNTLKCLEDSFTGQVDDIWPIGDDCKSFAKCCDGHVRQGL